MVFAWSSGQKRAQSISWIVQRAGIRTLGFLPGERNWHWWERAQASYARLKGTLRRESSYGLGFHKLPNVSERSSSQRWNLTSCGYFWLNVSHTQVPHLSQGDPSHLTRPHCIFRRTKSRQEADLQSQGRSIRLARSPHLPQKHHQQTVPATALLCSGRTTVPGLSNSKYLLPLQTKEYVLCFTLLQKWLLEVKDTSFVKLPINKTVFTGVQMAAQRHGVAFAAPTPFTYHRNEEQIQVTTVSHWGRSKDIRSKSNLRNRMQEELIFRGSEYFLIFYPNYYNGQYLYKKTND